MICLIAGATHTGKTLCAQRCPCFLIDRAYPAPEELAAALKLNEPSSLIL